MCMHNLLGKSLPVTIALPQPNNISVSYDSVGFQVEKVICILTVVGSMTKEDAVPASIQMFRSELIGFPSITHNSNFTKQVKIPKTWMFFLEK